MSVARVFINKVIRLRTVNLRCTIGGMVELAAIALARIRATRNPQRVIPFTEHGTYVDDKGKTTAWAPNRHRSHLLEALGAVCLLPVMTQPSWLDRRAAGTIVATTNGLLDITSRKLIIIRRFTY
jgi:hypothetical protein